MLIFELEEIDDNDRREYQGLLDQIKYQSDPAKLRQAQENLPKIRAEITSAYRDILVTLWENSSAGFMGMMYRVNIHAFGIYPLPEGLFNQVSLDIKPESIENLSKTGKIEEGLRELVQRTFPGMNIQEITAYEKTRVGGKRTLSPDDPRYQMLKEKQKYLAETPLPTKFSLSYAQGPGKKMVAATLCQLPEIAEAEAMTFAVPALPQPEYRSAAILATSENEAKEELSDFWRRDQSFDYTIYKLEDILALPQPDYAKLQQRRVEKALREKLGNELWEIPGIVGMNSSLHPLNVYVEKDSPELQARIEQIRLKQAPDYKIKIIEKGRVEPL